MAGLQPVRMGMKMQGAMLKILEHLITGFTGCGSRRKPRNMLEQLLILYNLFYGFPVLKFHLTLIKSII